MFRIAFVTCLLLGTIFGAANAAEKTAPGPSRLAAEDKVSALARKADGDGAAARGDYRKAAEAYAEALGLARSAFSRDERTAMAVTMSWGGKIGEAIRELRAVLDEDPSNARARVHLAKALSWDGRTTEAVAEADKVLAASPSDRDALLAKADALRYRGDNRQAIGLYKAVLAGGDDFDARLGLAHAELAEGDVAAARADGALLQPRYPYQEAGKRDFDAAFARTARPTTLSGGYSYYHDSDRNRVNRYTLSAGRRLGRWTLDLGYRHIDADDPTRDERADDLSLAAGARVADSLSIGAGIGGTRTGRGNSDDFFTGHARADLRVGAGTIGAAASREAFTDTAQLIENRIRFTHVAGHADFPLPGRLSASARYSYKDYSDINTSHDWQGSLRYAFRLKNPVVGAGYRIRFLDFDRETGSGYFDPSSFVSHAGFVTLSGERGRFRAYLEPYGGYQSFTRSGSRTNSWFAGGSGVLGYRISDAFRFEVTGEGGDYAGGTAAGFNYYMFGARLVATF
ncbi:MAG: tetratricopeptide repeat protein [Deltaproteobacteria bacterium]